VVRLSSLIPSTTTKELKFVETNGMFSDGMWCRYLCFKHFSILPPIVDIVH
jgi:hypothetical protein